MFQMTPWPILRNCIRKDPSRMIERRRNDRSSFILKRYSSQLTSSAQAKGGERWKEEKHTLESSFRFFVPEIDRTVWTGCRECSVRMEWNVVYGENSRRFRWCRFIFPMTLFAPLPLPKSAIHPSLAHTSRRLKKLTLKVKFELAILSSTCWIATLPSIVPTAYPLASGKQDITLVCHRKGEVIVLKAWVGWLRLKIWMWRSAVPTTIKGYWTSSAVRLYPISSQCVRIRS